MQKTKRIIAVLMAILMLVSAVPANVFAVVDESNPIELSKTKYEVGEAVIPEVYPQNDQSYSWIGLYAAADKTDGSVPAFYYIYTCYVNDQTDFADKSSNEKFTTDTVRNDYDEFVSNGRLLAGEYKIVYFANYGSGEYAYNDLGTVNFTVGDGEEEEPSDIDTYCTGEPVYHTPTTDISIVWMGLYKQSVTPAGSTSNAWTYPSLWSYDKDIACYDTWTKIDDNANADLNDDSVFNYRKDTGSPWYLVPGEYKFVYFGDDGYTYIIDQYDFKVVDHDYTKGTEVGKKASFTDNGVINSVCDCGDTNALSEIVKASATLEYNSVQADGTEKKPAVTVLDGEGNKISAEDYTVVYDKNVEKGDATATVTLNNDKYEGTVVLTFTITEADHKCEFNIPFVEPATFENDGRSGKKCTCNEIDADSITVIPALTATLEYDKVNYDGTEKCPVVTVNSGDTVLVLDDDYEAAYASNTNVGTATVTVTLKGESYSGTKVLTFDIKSMSVQKTTFCFEEPIMVTAHQVVSDTDWVAIYLKGETNEQGYLYYYYVRDAADGQPFAIQEGVKGGGHALDYLPAGGDYTLKLMTNDSYNVIETLDITIKRNHTSEVVPGYDATCDEPGLTDGSKCTDCGKVLTAQEEIPASHTEEEIPAVEKTCTTAGYTVGVKCSVCEEILEAPEEIPASHTEEVIPAVEKTCTTAGYTAGVKCSVCEEILEAPEEVPASHAEEVIPAVEKTCTTVGYTEGVKCSVCEEILEAPEEIPASHTEEIIPAVPSTCSEYGLSEGLKCSVCDKVLVAQLETEKLAHSNVIDEAVEATCTENGLTEGTHCSVCGAITSAQVVIPSKGHNEVVVKGYAATCTENGKTDGKKCSVCTAVTVEQQVITASGHTEVVLSAVEPTCTEKGLTEGKKCSVCGKTIEAQKEIAPFGHKDVTVAGKAATCTDKGYTDGKKCSVCGTVTVAQKEISALGHNEVIIEGKAATCVDGGITDGKKCTACGKVTVAQKEVAPLGHKEEVIAGKAATCTEDGITDGKKCTDCGIVLVEQTVVKASGHNEVALPAVEATYTADGLTEGKKCTACGVVTVAQKKVSRKKLSKVTGLKVKKTTTTTVKLSWKKVTGAESYKVYYSTNGKKWKSVKATKNSVTVKKLTSGKNYQFKVKAVAGKYTGTASATVKTATKVKKVTLSSVKSAKKTQATVTWKTVSGASGYVVEYSTSKKFKNKKTATLKKGTTKKTTLKKLKSGKKYYVRVKAYKTVNGKKVYGSVSAVKTVKVK